MDKNVGSTVLLSVHPMRGMMEGGLLAAVKQTWETFASQVNGLG